MKQYKLLKDTPTIKVGTVFQEVTSDFDGAKELVRITPIGAKTNPQWTIKDIDNFDEWFEEIQEEPTDSIHWKPKLGDCYWTVYDTGGSDQYSWDDCPIDIARYKMGRTYRTEKEAEKARDHELAEVRLRRTSNFEPDFKLGRGGYAIYYDYALHGLRAHSLGSIDSGEPVRYETYEEAEKSIKENEKDWLIYFGVKNG